MVGGGRADLVSFQCFLRFYFFLNLAPWTSLTVPDASGNCREQYRCAGSRSYRELLSGTIKPLEAAPVNMNMNININTSIYMNINMSININININMSMDMNMNIT